MSDCCGESENLIYACSGGSDVGFLSDRVARMLAVTGHGKMHCLAGIGAGIESFITGGKAAAVNIVVDGCAVRCGAKVFDRHGIRYDSYVITEFGFEKNNTGMSEDAVKTAFLRINPAVEGKMPESVKKGQAAGGSSCCCGG
ncbi:MAG TPA: hypothetical protein ENN43_05635 [bacterium]|nr:hypothetical protein [bacterium]